MTTTADTVECAAADQEKFFARRTRLASCNPVLRIRKSLKKQTVDNKNGRGNIAASLNGTDADSEFELRRFECFKQVL
ncbi:hypothetical protein EOPP23_05835 [Endozoicomonas sp. OPT23]|nr:hypothetical protein [Endozoicomonas sp. OPT23]